MKKHHIPIEYIKKIFIISLTLFLVQCGVEPEPGSEEHIRNVTSQINDEYLANANKYPENWVTYGGNYDEDRYSSLKQIEKKNVNQLGLKWALNLGTRRGIEATPLVVDGIMFLTSNWSMVHAINVRTGENIWSYDPKVSKAFGKKLVVMWLIGESHYTRVRFL